MKQHLQDFVSFLAFLPLLAIASIQENGPSWKEIAAAVIGGAFTITIGFGGYWLAQQDKAIGDLRDAYVEAKITMVGLRASVENLTESTKALKEQVTHERNKRETREAEERAELRAAHGKK